MNSKLVNTILGFITMLYIGHCKLKQNFMLLLGCKCYYEAAYDNFTVKHHLVK